MPRKKKPRHMARAAKRWPPPPSPFGSDPKDRYRLAALFNGRWIVTPYTHHESRAIEHMLARAERAGLVAFSREKNYNYSRPGALSIVLTERGEEVLSTIRRVPVDVAKMPSVDARAEELAQRSMRENPGHTKDEDCTLGDDGTCLVCGVSHTAECYECGGRGFHRPRCPESDDEPKQRANPSPYNGLPVHHRGTTMFIPLPRAAWEPIGSPCSCAGCIAAGPGAVAYWDTLALSTKRNDPMTWTVHAPELHAPTPKRNPRAKRKRD